MYTWPVHGRVHSLSRCRRSVNGLYRTEAEAKAETDAKAEANDQKAKASRHCLEFG